MSTPTRRQLMTAGLAAVGAAGVPAVAMAADPEVRLQNAVQELRDALQARWPGCELCECDFLEPTPTLNPAFMIAAKINRARDG